MGFMYSFTQSYVANLREVRYAVPLLEATEADNLHRRTTR